MYASWKTSSSGRGAVRGASICREDLQLAAKQPKDMTRMKSPAVTGIPRSVEKDAILEALEKTRFNKTAAAKLLGITFGRCVIAWNGWGWISAAAGHGHPAPAILVRSSRSPRLPRYSHLSHCRLPFKQGNGTIQQAFLRIVRKRNRSQASTMKFQGDPDPIPPGSDSHSHCGQGWSAAANTLPACFARDRQAAGSSQFAP